ncbi:MAG: ATP-dependent RNA helicase RhlB [Oleiphilus sp.]|nr:MAG: ATP-dependent RNA helicase RhlB [Oleiphilus sp.]
MLGGLFGKKSRSKTSTNSDRKGAKQEKPQDKTEGKSSSRSRGPEAAASRGRKSGPKTDVKSAAQGRSASDRQDSAKSAGPKQPAPSSDASRQQTDVKASTSQWTPDQYVVEAQEGKTRFHDLGLDLNLLHAIADLNYEYCSEIQAESLPHTLQGHDVIGKAQTGTGKTAAFLITIINDLIHRPIPAADRFASEPRALILAPTRELALQIEKDARALTKYAPVSVYSVVGGIDYQRQRDYVHNEVIDILVATPGRLIDFLNSGDLYLDQLDFLVIDEADRMLDMGFIPDVKRILSRCPKVDQRQTLMFSATFNQDVMNLSKRWTSHPIYIEIEAEQMTTERVEQKIFMVPADEKLEIMCRYIETNDITKAIVFGNRRDETRRLEATLKKKGVKAALLSGEVPQHKRIKTLDQFKNGQIEILVATDVAGRGIHVDGVSHVFNYNLPEDPEDYVHRIGRTGRANETGVSVSFACEDDAFLLPEIEKYIGMKLNCEYPDYLLDTEKKEK